MIEQLYFVAIGGALALFGVWLGAKVAGRQR